MILLRLFNLLILCFCAVAYGKEFRINATENLYTLHLDRTTWREAKRICEAEGAALFVPENEVEAKEAQSMVPESERSYGPWIGVSSRLSEGSNIYVTIDGRPFSVVFNKRYNGWSEGPNDCVVMAKDTTLYGYNCDDNNRWIFICKFPLTGTYAPTTTGSGKIEIKGSTLSETDDITVATDNYSRQLDQLCGKGDCALRGLVNADSKSHFYFGSLVADELKTFPPKEKLQIMVSVLEAIKTYWDVKCSD